MPRQNCLASRRAVLELEKDELMSNIARLAKMTDELYSKAAKTESPRSARALRRRARRTEQQWKYAQLRFSSPAVDLLSS
jgi:hypothetical protein